MRLLPLLLSCGLGLGCSSTPMVPDAGPDLAPSNALVAARPYTLVVPTANYDPKVPAPVLLLLHGYGASGAEQDALFMLHPFTRQQGILYAYPDGTVDQTGQRFWNATDACCDFYHTGVDDVAYLSAVLDDIETHYNVDKKQIFVAGHSNGGFMAYRLACDISQRVAAFLSLAGANWMDTSHCQPQEPVAGAQVHGTADDEVPYNGDVAEDIPSALQSISFFAQYDGCSPQPDPDAGTLDIDRIVPGPETTIERWTGCKSAAAELWTMAGVGHIPNFQPTWPSILWGFLSAHPKP